MDVSAVSSDEVYARAVVAALKLAAGAWQSLTVALGLRKYDRQPSSEASSSSLDGPI